MKPLSAADVSELRGNISRWIQNQRQPWVAGPIRWTIEEAQRFAAQHIEAARVCELRECRGLLKQQREQAHQLAGLDPVYHRLRLPSIARPLVPRSRRCGVPPVLLVQPSYSRLPGESCVM
jgi:hypothetical protein